MKRDEDFLLDSLRHLRLALDAEEREYEVDTKLGIDLSRLNGPERSILAASLSDVQVRSKLWLLNCIFRWIPNSDLTILVLGGWCGVLPWLASLTGRGSNATWISIDSDSKACSVGQRAFGTATPNLLFACNDIYDLDYRQFASEGELIIINTICEHLHDFSCWRSRLPEGTMTILQSNNYRSCPDHINCVDSVENLVESAGFRHVLYQGSLKLSLFTRFMVIGRT